jgi:hypothetical protein
MPAFFYGLSLLDKFITTAITIDLTFSKIEIYFFKI